MLRGPILALFVVATSYGLVLPVLPALIDRAGGADLAESTGALMAMYTLATVVASPLWGFWLDRGSPRRILVVGLVGQALVQWGLLITTSLAELYALRALQGAFAAAAMPAVLTMAARLSLREEYAAAVARATRAALLGTLVGPILGGALAEGDDVWRPLAATSALTLVAAWTLLRLRIADAVPGPLVAPPLANRPRLWRLAVAAVVAGTAMGMMEVGISVRGREAMGLSAASIGLMFSGCGLVMIAVQTLVFRPTRTPESLWRLMAPALLLSALGVGSLASAREPWMLGAVVAVVAAGGGVLQPTISLWIARSAGRAQGVQLGLRAALGGIGQASGALLAGFAFRLNSGQWVWIVLVVALAGATAAMLARSTPPRASE